MANIQINCYAKTLGMFTRINAILPHTGEDIPCLYLLHGIGGDSTAWARFGGIEQYADGRGIAVIMPETYLGAYANTAYGVHYWDYFAQELPALIHGLIPQISTRRERSFVAGQSMGGFGAMKLGLGTDRFCAVASISGALHNLGQPGSADGLLQFAPKALLEGIVGPLENVKGSANDIYALADGLIASGQQPPAIRISCGRQDPFYAANVEAVRLLAGMGIPVAYHEADGGHDWPYWNAEIQHVLDWLPVAK